MFFLCFSDVFPASCLQPGAALAASPTFLSLIVSIMLPCCQMDVLALGVRLGGGVATRLNIHFEALDR